MPILTIIFTQRGGGATLHKGVGFVLPFSWLLCWFGERNNVGSRSVVPPVGIA